MGTETLDKGLCQVAPDSAEITMEFVNNVMKSETTEHEEENDSNDQSVENDKDAKFQIDKYVRLFIHKSQTIFTLLLFLVQ